MLSHSDKLHPVSQSSADGGTEIVAGPLPSIVALVATFNRPKEVHRLLESLARHRNVLARVVIVDNASATAIDQVLEPWGEWVIKLAPDHNLGCGGGLKHAYEEGARRVPLATHFLIVDDDAVIPPGTLESLVAAMDSANADLATPLILGPDHYLGWTPGLYKRKAHRKAQRIREHKAFLDEFGSQPVPFLWACGVCLLLSRRTMEENGSHREDFWVRGEDIEFSLRHTKHRDGIVVPTLTVDHLPPSTSAPISSESEFLKHAALVQNICYLTCRLPHGRRLRWTIPGALKHFFQTWGFRGVLAASQAVWAGAVLGYPAGRGKGEGEAEQNLKFE